MQDPGVHSSASVIWCLRRASSRTPTSPDLLKERGIAISIDGKGCWRDTVFVERFWTSIEYEVIYLRGYDR